MPLSVAQKSQIRRHLGYENIGFSSAFGAGGGTLGTNMGHLASSTYGELETKMNSLQPCDESAITGRAYGSVQFLGLEPEVGDQVNLTFSNVPGITSPFEDPVVVNFTVTENEAGSMGKLAMAMARAVSNKSELAILGFRALAPYGPGSTVLNPMAEFSVTSAVVFLLSATSTGSVSAVVQDDGSELPEPSAQVGKVAGVPKILNGYLPLLNYLYGAIATATTRQGTVKADVFTARQDEVEARTELYEFYRRDFATFLGVPVNTRAKGGRPGQGAVIL